MDFQKISGKVLKWQSNVTKKEAMAYKMLSWGLEPMIKQLQELQILNPNVLEPLMEELQIELQMELQIELQIFNYDLLNTNLISIYPAPPK